MPCSMTWLSSTSSMAPTLGLARQQRHTLHVVGHREQVEGPQRREPVAVLGEDRHVAGERGGVAGHVRRPRAAGGRRPARRPRAGRPPAAGRAPPGRTARRRTTRAPGPPARSPPRPRRRGCGARGCPPAGPPRRRRAARRPDRVEERAGEQPDPRVEVERRLAGLRPQQVEHRRDQHLRRARVDLPEPALGDGSAPGLAPRTTARRRPPAGTRRRAPPRGSGASASRDDRRGARRSAAGCATAAPRGRRGRPRPRPDVEAGQPASAARGPRPP